MYTVVAALETFFDGLVHFFELVASIEPLVWVINVVLFVVVAQALRMLWRLSYNKVLGLTTGAYSQNGNGKRILLLGDSTAVGTGASRGEDTIAGRLAADFPDAAIMNLGKNGGLVRDLRAQVAQAQGQRFDLILVSVGGNDVWHLTSLRSIRRHLLHVLPLLIEQCDGRIMFFIYNNIGSAPIFPSLIQKFLRWRGVRVQRVIREVAEAHLVATIDLFDQEDDNPFLRDPDLLFAADGVHPSSEGYRLWYHRMWRQITERGYHF